MKKKKKYLPLYYKWMESGELPGYGLCGSIGDEVTELFGPSGDYISDREWCWGYSGDITIRVSVKELLREFTPLRQTIVLFLAAMNDEL